MDCADVARDAVRVEGAEDTRKAGWPDEEGESGSEEGIDWPIGAAVSSAILLLRAAVVLARRSASRLRACSAFKASSLLRMRSVCTLAFLGCGTVGLVVAGAVEAAAWTDTGAGVAFGDSRDAVCVAAPDTSFFLFFAACSLARYADRSTGAAAGALLDIDERFAAGLTASSDAAVLTGEFWVEAAAALPV